MAKALLYDLWMDTTSQQLARMRVAQIVKPNAGKAPDAPNQIRKFVG